MKVRIVVISLMFVVAFMLASCSNGETDSADKSRQENRDAAPTIDPQAKTDITNELNQATTLLNQVKDELDKGGGESQAKARRLLGYPAFLIADFNDPQGFAKKLQTGGPLSQYLFSNFTSPRKDLLQNERADPTALASALRDELDRQLENKKLYDREHFPNLTPETSKELQRNQPRIDTLSPQELANLNRLLLQDANTYSKFIKPAETENVLRHLTQAQKLTQSLTPSDVQRNTLAKINYALASTLALLNRPSAESEHEALLVSDIEIVSGNVTDASKSLKTPGTTAPAFTDWLMGIVWDVAYYLVLILAVVVPLALIAFFIKNARDNAAAKEHANLQVLKKLSDRNDHLQQEFTTFKNQNSSEIDSLKDQISRLESAYRMLARKNDQYADSSSRNSPNINRYYEPPPAPVKEEPEFPVSAEIYLEKMKGSNRFSTVIRPDFQNGILVKDSDGRGELVLIEDPTRSVDFQRLFVVPSVSQFQMKQDFYNYYDGYYECDQPAAGNVWIVHPAIVEKVNGGWRLMEKGRLEVRA